MNRGPSNVITGPRNVIMGPCNVNRVVWNVIRNRLMLIWECGM